MSDIASQLYDAAHRDIVLRTVLDANTKRNVTLRCVFLFVKSIHKNFTIRMNDLHNIRFFSILLFSIDKIFMDVTMIL